MKVKWNWGTKLFISMVAFMLFLIAFFVLMTQQTYHLVEKDYYPKALEYQQRIDKTENAKQLAERVKLENKGDFLIFTFQSFFNPEEVTGKITLYRPSDGAMDIAMEIHLDSLCRHIFPVNDIQKGKYLAKIEYANSEEEYYQEMPVFVKMFQH
jgi:hypothetical protein